MAEFPHPTECCPHRAPALLIERIMRLGVGNDLGIAEGIPLPDWNPLQLIEAGAQAIAVLYGAACYGKQGRGCSGLLVGLDQVSAHSCSGITSFIVETQSRFGGLGAFQVLGVCGNAPVLTGRYLISLDASAGGIGRPDHNRSPGFDPIGDIANLLSPDRFGTSLIFPKELPVLAGHFPGMPLVPGIHVLAMFLHALKLELRNSVRLGKTRFVRPIVPDTLVHFSNRRKSDDWDCTALLEPHLIAVHARIKSNGQP